MLATFLLAALAQATTLVPFEGPEADNRSTGLALDASGDNLLIAHRATRSISHYDVQTGLVTGRMAFDPGPSNTTGQWRMRWIPGTRHALVLIQRDGVLLKIDTQSMAVLDEVSLGAFANTHEIAITSDGSTCAIAALLPEGLRLCVLDLSDMTSLNRIDISQLQESEAIRNRAWITSDDRRAVIVGPDPSSPTELTLLGYSLATGALEVVAPQAVSAREFREVQQSLDRSTWMIAHPDLPGSDRYFRIVGSDLSSANSLTLTGFGSDLGEFKLNPTGSRAFGLLDASVFAFPTDQPSVSPTSSGVIRFPSDEATTFRVSGDGSRVLIGSKRRRSSLFDGDGAPIATNLGSSFSWRHPSTTRVEGTAPVFAHLESSANDQIAVLDGRVAASSLAERHFNSSPLDSFDGPYGLQQLRDSTEMAVVAISSSKLRVIDIATGESRTTSSLVSNPTAMDERSDGQILVGHRDGTLLSLDPATLAETSRIALGGIIEHVEAEPSGTRAWVRVGGTLVRPFGASLVLVETAGPQAGVLGSIGLAGSVIRPRSYSSPSTIYFPAGNADPFLGFQDSIDSASIVFDFPRNRAYALSPLQEVIETLDLLSLSQVAVDPMPLFRFGAYSYPKLTLSPTGEHLIVALSESSGLWRITASGLVNVILLDGNWPGASRYSQGFSDDGSIAFMSDNPQGPSGLVAAIDVASGQILDTLSGPGYRGLVARGDDLVLLSYKGIDLARFDGASFSAPERIMETEGRSPVLFDPKAGILVSAERGTQASSGLITGKGLQVANLFSGRVQMACEGGVPNATNVQAQLTAGGSVFAGEELTLTTTDLAPQSMLGVLLVSDTLTSPMPGASSVGEFCLGGNLRRVVAPLTAADAAGQRHYSLSSGAIATSTGPLAVSPGETVTFQEWHRDSTPAGLPTSNTSTALAITFR